MKIETVKVKLPKSRLGYMIINKSDYDPKVHSLVGKKKAQTRKVQAKPFNLREKLKGVK